MNTSTNMTNTDVDPALLADFGKWKEFLGDKIDQAHSAGMSNQQIADTAVKFGSYLANKVDPKNVQERLLKQMWDVSSKEEQHTLARIIINLVQGQGTTH